jgi:integrase/recombinase XerD
MITRLVWGVGLAADLVAWRRVSRGSYKPFLHHVTKGRPIPVRPVKLMVPRLTPRTLDPGQVATILGACEHLRDRFLMALLAETGIFSWGQVRHAGLCGCFGRPAAW